MQQKNLWENSHVLPAAGVYPEVVNECLNVNTNSSISEINNENVPLQRRRKIVCFFIWIFFVCSVGFCCLVFFPRTMITSRQPTQQQVFSKSLAKQQQWLNFRCSTLRSGLFCPIRNTAAVTEPTPAIPAFPELPSSKTQLGQSRTPPSTLDLVSSMSHSSGGWNIPAALVSPLLMFI